MSGNNLAKPYDLDVRCQQHYVRVVVKDEAIGEVRKRRDGNLIVTYWRTGRQSFQTSQDVSCNWIMDTYQDDKKGKK